LAHLAINLAYESTPTWNIDVDKLNNIVAKYKNKYNKEEVESAE
jgi:hypothetical protein